MTNTGTQIKYRISLDLPNLLTMDDIRFDAEFFVYSYRAVKINKADMKRVDANTYDALCDTALIGRGEIKLRITAYLPTAYGERKEIETISTKTLTV